MKYLIPLFCLSLIACTTEPQTEEWVDLSEREKPEPVVTGGWQTAVFSVPDMESFARIFTEIGSFETVERLETSWILRAPETTDGYVQLVQNDNPEAVPARPLDATAWDTGCYWSLMMRAKDIASIIADARELGWDPLTEMAYLEFGPSQLNIVVLRHQVTGAQIQLYERLTTPLPEGFPEFERISRPFNIMQMVADRDAAYDFFQQTLGFETFYYGKPFLSPEPSVMPLGIPVELTTKVPYKAAITYPETGMEWGRFEMIEIDGEAEGLVGRDFSDQCTRENYGLIEIQYDLKSFPGEIHRVGRRIGEYFTEPVTPGKAVPIRKAWVISPDGAQISFIP